MVGDVGEYALEVESRPLAHEFGECIGDVGSERGDVGGASELVDNGSLLQRTNMPCLLPGLMIASSPGQWSDASGFVDDVIALLTGHS